MVNMLSDVTHCAVRGQSGLPTALDLGSHPVCNDLVPLGEDRSCKQYPSEILFCDVCRTANQRFQVPKRELFPSVYHYRAPAVRLADQAGWHMSMRLAVPPNITIIALSPKSPELNPVENVLQFMRKNWLSNQVFKSYDDLVDHCCDAWNKLTDPPWRVMPHRITPMGARVLINGTWYKPAFPR